MALHDFFCPSIHVLVWYDEPYAGVPCGIMDQFSSAMCRRDHEDFARLLRDLSDVHYPEAEVIVLVLDNLNTHELSVLYQVYPPDEARRLYSRFEVHYTPKHASWLNIAECELSVLSRQCLDRRIDSQEFLVEEFQGWETARNLEDVCVEWQFHNCDARIKLKRLYPVRAPVDSNGTDH